MNQEQYDEYMKMANKAKVPGTNLTVGSLNEALNGLDPRLVVRSNEIAKQFVVNTLLGFGVPRQPGQFLASVQGTVRLALAVLANEGYITLPEVDLSVTDEADADATVEVTYFIDPDA